MSRDKDSLANVGGWTVATLLVTICEGSWFTFAFFLICYWLFRIELAEVTWSAAERDLTKMEAGK